MTLLIAWLVFPLVLGLLSLGCGLALEYAAGVELPWPLLLPLGFAAFSLVAQLAIIFGPTVQFATPAVVMLAVASFGLSLPGSSKRLDGWCAAAAGGVYCVFAAPIVLSGRATFAGYIKLDDTATYLAMLDRAMGHGYNVAGLTPSTYEATLNTSLAYGYPLGSLLPLGVGRVLVGENLAWLWQPYLTFLAALLAFGLYQLVAGLVRSRRLRALVAFFGAQAALIYGYALWGGVKELAVAVLIALAVSLVPSTAAGLARPRTILPLAAASAALVGVLSVGGAVWLAPLLGAAVLLAVGSAGLRTTLRGSAAFVAAAGVLGIPTFVAAVTWLSHAGAFTGGSEYANLRGKLSWLQVFGIWPNGDFRLPPKSLDVTHALVAVVAAAALLGLWLAWRRRAWELPVAAVTAAVGCAVYVGAASPWVGGKALASASPLVLTIALAGLAAHIERGRRLEGSLVAGILIAGVLWSNVLQYHAVDLAPSGTLGELASIGDRFAGQGPALMTDYQAYGVRHFLRGMDAEGASELRRHVVPLRAGGVADTGITADIDEFQLSGVLFYRTLVLRRSPLASRPPSDYQLVSSGRDYEVWQRSQATSSILEHLSLGGRFVSAAVPPCSEVLRLARLAAANRGVLATVERPLAIVLETNGTAGPPTQLNTYGEDPLAFYLRKKFTMKATFSTSVGGDYGVWLGGTFRAQTDVTIDGVRVGGARGQIDWPNTYVQVGTTALGRGNHVLALEYRGSDLRPGSAGVPEFGLGPIAIGVGTADRPVTHVSPARARSLCGKSLDWVEALRGTT